MYIIIFFLNADNATLDNVFGQVLVSIVSFLGGSIAFGDQVNQHNDIDITASLAQIAKAKPTIFAR